MQKMVMTARMLSWLLMLMLLSVMLQVNAATSRPNVLFLVSDDMRPQLSCYDSDGDFPTPVHPAMVTPNLDKLAQSSILLRRAYVQQAICNPSRTSVLTGRRPDTTHVFDNGHYWRKVGGNYTTIPQYFKENGYYTIGAGKIFHNGPNASGNDDPISWTDKYYRAPDHYQDVRKSWYSVAEDRLKKYPLVDQLNTQYIVDKLKEIASNGTQPFFVGLGIHRPHLPFASPAKFFYYYPTSSIRLAANPHAPAYMPVEAWYDYKPELSEWTDLKATKMTGAINTTFPDWKARELRRAYYAAITYADSLFGTVLDTIESLGLANSTIVSFWGDHGWQLGEHSEWSKLTNFDIAIHAPMMVHVPRLTDHGIISRHLVEFVDLFPTLVDAAGLPSLPLCPEGKSTTVEICREGSSFVPLMKAPEQDWKSAVFSQFPRAAIVRDDAVAEKTNKTLEGSGRNLRSTKDRTAVKGGDLETPGHMQRQGVHVPVSNGNSLVEIMGYSLRTDRYHYIEWVTFNNTVYEPVWDKLHAAELYDHGQDPEENWNRAVDGAYADVRAQLHKTLRAGWRAALPDPTA